MRKKSRAVIEMTIGLLVMAGSVQAASTFINTCPTVISSPGDYLLSADLICGGGTGITITSSDVTLKLEGYRITAGVGANVGVSSAISNSSGGITGASVARVHILGPGLITNGGGNAFFDGVALVGFVTNSEVSGITVLGSRFAGIEANGQVLATDLTFTANTLGRNGTGIAVINLNSSTISKNDVSGNGVGISILNPEVVLGPPIMVRHNIVNGNTGDGVTTQGGAFLRPTVTVQNNVIVGNGGNGISGEIVLEITHNVSLTNGMFDLFDPEPGCLGHVWSGNTFFTANQSCIH